MHRGWLLVLLSLTGCAASVDVGDPNALLDKTEQDVTRAYGWNYISAASDDPVAVDGKEMIYRMRSVQDILMYGNPFAPLVESDCSLIFTLYAGRVKYTTTRGTSCR